MISSHRSVGESRADALLLETFRGTGRDGLRLRVSRSASREEIRQGSVPCFGGRDGTWDVVMTCSCTCLRVTERRDEMEKWTQSED